MATVRDFLARLKKVLIPTAAALLLAACASTAPSPPATWEGLELRSSSQDGALYVRPDFRAPRYRTVVIDPLAVAPDKDWMPVRDVRTGVVIARHPASTEELLYIEDRLGAALRETFVRELAASGYRVLDRPQDDTLRVSCGLANVNIDTPATGMGRLREDDSMTLVADLYDGLSGQLVARIIDTKKGKWGMLETPNSVVTNRAFQQVVRDWSGRLRSALDTVNDPLSRAKGRDGVLARAQD